MTDPTPNNLPEPLSSWTAVDVIRAVADLPKEPEVPFNVVDVVRAVADLPTDPSAKLYAAAEWGYNQALAAQRAIATELENHQ